MRAGAVMQALRDEVGNARDEGREFIDTPEDEILRKLRSITGSEWSSNDPADLAAYAEDPSPLNRFTMPEYVTLPGNEQEVSQILRLCREYNLAWMPRGNGSDTMGFVISKGLILDLHRMNSMKFDPENWSVTVGPGVSAFELQQEADRRGYRVSTAETSALVCANTICSGVFSLFSATYGIMADNVIDARIVNGEGECFRLNDRNASNFYAFFKEDVPSPGVCTEVTVLLHPKFNDEQGVLVPFEKPEQAIPFIREMSMRGIGTAVGLLGPGYISSFLTPTLETDVRVRTALAKTIGLGCFVLVIGTAHDIAWVRDHAETIIDQDQFSAFMLGLPSLMDEEMQDLMTMHGDGPAMFRFLFQKQLFPFLKAALKSSPANYAGPVDSDLRPFFESLYSRPEMTDLVWLNSFRILSTRLGRKKPFVAFILYVPLDKPEVISSMLNDFAEIGKRNQVECEFGFMTPLDSGRRAILEYDFFHEYRNETERNRILQAVGEMAGLIAALSASTQGITWIRYVVNQGFARKEPMLYGRYPYDAAR
jgi:hypothetical protein